MPLSWTDLDVASGAAEPAQPLPNPFDELGPSALARRAAGVLQAELRAGRLADGLAASVLDAPQGGKMFGVLVVAAPDGRLGFLRAFSGTIDGRFDVPGYAPPVFDREARASVEPAGESVVKHLTARAEAFAASAEVAQARAALAGLEKRHREELAALARRHAVRREQRRSRRTAIVAAPEPRVVAPQPPLRRGLRVALQTDVRPELQPEMHELAQQSRADKAERRRLEAAHAAERADVEAAQRRLERRLAAHQRLHRIVSRRLMRQIHDTYRIPNARGEVRGLRELYAPAEPPGGAGDCAAPKLLAHAYAQGLRPVALAEFWWGAPPSGGARVQGAFYPACREKCAALLAWMMEGLDVAPARRFRAPDPGALELDVVFEDEWIVVVDKPCGLLSVPSRSGVPDDSVLARLRLRHADALLVHRLDLDTSGLLVAARDARTHAALQRQFVRRTVEKRYVAIVEGRVRGEAGTIDLPMRVDVNDRPRQIIDAVHGRSAVTDWRVLERSVRCDGEAASSASGGTATAPGAGAAPERTRVAFFPRSGRSHQLRVHAAHPLGLGAPIAGDRLYGREGGRLMLHAERLSFTHPATGARVAFESHAPF